MNIHVYTCHCLKPLLVFIETCTPSTCISDEHVHHQHVLVMSVCLEILCLHANILGYIRNVPFEVLI